MPLSGTSAGCNTHTLTDHLSERGLMAYGQSADDLEALTDRNADRVRLLKHLTRTPEGVKQSNLVHWVLKGHRPDNWHGFHDLSGDEFSRHDDWHAKLYRDGDLLALDGSDDDYQFCNRFLNDCEEAGLVRLERLDGDDTRGRWAFPTLRLLDLISEGITETAGQSDDLVYDRDFARSMLKSTRSRLLELSDSQKQHLANSLRRYIQRTRDYKLAFDVHMADRNGYECRRMTKPFKTRFSDSGRSKKNIAMLQDSLEWGYDHADSAVFATLTTDPKKHDSLWDAISAINENFHALNQYLKTDPSTKDDTRLEATPSWDGPNGSWSGRPRQKLEYVKVLEFTSKGYPHLHVLYFDPPRRQKDGCPWLVDKEELSHYWNKDTDARTGQGAVVDLYPLTFRDDLDDLEGVNFNDSEGFVSWYRYGDHDHDQEWIDARCRFHSEQGQIDFDGADDNNYQKTAGSYIGKYVTETFAKLTNLEELDDPDFEEKVATDGDKSTWWKLALYWATNRRFWSPSRTIRRDIKLDGDRAAVRRGVADATKTSLLHHAERLHDDHALYPDFDHDRAESVLHHVTRDVVAESDLEAQDADETVTTLARVEYLGAFHHTDLPPSHRNTVSPRALESRTHGSAGGVVLLQDDDRPPPSDA